MRPTIIKIAAWGERYIESLYRNILPCLAAVRNMPLLWSPDPVDLLIYTDDISVKRLKAVGLSGFNITIRLIEALPPADNLSANRTVLAWTDADSIRIAKERGADWMSFQADTLVSSEFLPNVKRLLDSHLAVGGAPLRVSAERFEAAVGTRRDFDTRLLRYFSLQAMHPVMLDYFMRDPPRMIPADPHQFFFADGAGFVARTWQPCPLGLSYEAVANLSSSSSMTIDCYLISNLPPERVYFHKPSTDDFYLCSLDDETGIPTFGSFEMSPMGVAKSICKFARSEREAEAYVRALEQRYVYPSLDFAALPKDCCDEKASVSAIRDLVLQLEAVA